jgi:hypothetical protein
MAKGLKRRNGPGEDLEPEPGAARVQWWKSRLRAALKAGAPLEIPPGNLAAVLARFEVTRELARKGPKK